MRTQAYASARSELFGGPPRAGVPHSRNAAPSSHQAYGGMQMFEEESEDVIEEQIYQNTNQLRQGVSYIKDLSIAIDNHLNEERVFFNQVDNDMNNLQSGLQGAINRVKKLMKYSSTSHMCLMLVFVMFVFMIIYWMIRRSYSK
jgi:blocked-early-in-transport protein 1